MPKKIKNAEAKLTELVEIAKELSEATTTYSHEEDEVGTCIHCGEVSYKDHEQRCPITKLENFLKTLEP